MAWTKEQEDFLIETYPESGAMPTVLKFGKVRKTVVMHAARLGIKMNDQCRIRLLSKSGLKKSSFQYGENNPNWKGGISKNNYHYKKIQKERYPDRVAAREKVMYAIRSGLLLRGNCIICGKENAHAHHEDYSKPFEIIWLCRRHHNDWHRIND